MLDKFSQSWNLRFTNSNIELNFREECLKLHHISSLVTLAVMILLSLYFVFIKLLPIYFIAFYVVPLIPHSLLRNLSLEVASFVFIMYNYSKGTIPELLGCLLPSFLLQFFVWKHWEVFLIISLAKLGLICPKSILNAFFSVVFYSFLAYLFEKDFRDNWKKIKRHKEENHNYRELWMKIPYPAVIISQRLKIILMNHAANKAYSHGGKSMQEKSLDIIFTRTNYDVICGFIKKVFEGKEREEVIVKESNTVWLAVMKSVEWKFERCVELSLIEIVEANYSEKIFSLFYFAQEQCLGELNEAIIDNYESKEKVRPLVLEIFYRFCINYWSYQLFLEQQTEYFLSQEAKVLDFANEIINSIEFFNIKSSEKSVDYRFTNESPKVSILSNEIRIKLFLHVIIDFAKNTALNSSSIELTLQSFETNNTICYTFNCSFSADNIERETLSLIFENRKRNFEEFEIFAKKFSLSYALFSANLKALQIEVQEISYSKNKVALSFFIRFPISMNIPTSFPLQLSNKFIIRNSRILWHKNESNQSNSQSKLKIESQSEISVGFTHKTEDKIIIKFSEDGSSDDNITSKIQNRSPKSMPSIQKVQSFTGMVDILLNPNKVRRSSTTIKLRKSKKNTFESPKYTITNKRQVKKFLYKECLQNLNYEIGVYRVLIVDDFEENRKVLQELLKKVTNVSCEFAKDGIGAVDMYDNYSSQGYMYQIIFMDLIMPRMNGYQASMRIRQKEKENKYPRTFICAVSGNRDCSSKCFESEMNYIGMGYLALKPISVSMLEAVIRHRRDIEL
ncbi:hypothetical protein SteCoe_23629 [Stentor coeruleus]|uniref:Response regulatory domain-containing protein n=1 Tax=Stentor coeruleus TaxID=5963 RepID=A0A1R2BJF1_9CILI|nr:hypothetical protein SteCoe_23629 [Stentor coeruleus]